MPNSAEPAPDYVPADKKKQWEEVYKSAFQQAKKSGKSDKEAEQQAFAEANGVIKKEQKSMDAKREVRFFQAAELRVTPEGKITGYAAPFNKWSQDLGGFREQVAPGAFKRAIAEGQDVRALFNHNPSVVLGRTKSGTLTLAEDSNGLRYEINPPDTQAARDLMASIRRADITGSSFGFIVRRDQWSDDRDATGKLTGSSRTLLDVDLFDVSPVTYPAYPDSSVAMRAMWPDGVPAEIESRREKSASIEETLRAENDWLRGELAKTLK